MEMGSTLIFGLYLGKKKKRERGRENIRPDQEVAYACHDSEKTKGGRSGRARHWGRGGKGKGD